MNNRAQQPGYALRMTLARIGGLDAPASEAARRRQQSLTKPPGALGRLEELSIQLAGVTGSLRPPLRPCRVLVCAGDHGVTAEGVSAYPSEVTTQMVLNFLAGGAAVNVLARLFGADVTVVDVGVKNELPDHPQLIKAKIRPGANNFYREPAMTRHEALASIEVGIAVAESAIQEGARLLVTGDMGIGNTTASAAIAAVLTELPVSEVTGLGTGIGRDGWRHKIEVIERALEYLMPDIHDPVDILSKVGGLEIGAIAGIILAAAANRTPVIVDGVISTAGAALAVGLCPAVRAFLIPSHQSQEPGHRALLEQMDLRPLMTLDMRLGEGTGALLALPLLDAALATLNEMATFDEAGVSGPVE
jgi:nicotinate-nucleotide--dimethylbenzimidazole phosphoribosyltransferase